MNLPNYLIRLYLLLVPEERVAQIDQSATFRWLQDFSQLLYFAQVFGYWIYGNSNSLFSLSVCHECPLFGGHQLCVALVGQWQAPKQSPTAAAIDGRNLCPTKVEYPGNFGTKLWGKEQQLWHGRRRTKLLINKWIYIAYLQLTLCHFKNYFKLFFN
jgi:hypothetical protein